MKIIGFLLSVCLILLLLLPIFVSAQIEGITSFKEKYGQNWIINWDNITNTPSEIYGSRYDLKVGIIENKEKAEQVAYDFLSDNKGFFGIEKSDITLLKVEEGNNEWYVEYQQHYKSLLVYNCKVAVTLSKVGEFISAGSNLYQDININTLPQLSKEEAIQAAKKEFNYENIAIKNSSLIIFPKEGLVWEISLFSEEPLAGKEYFVDANTGKIVLQYDTIISSSIPPKDIPKVKYDSNKSSWFLIPTLIVVIGLLTFLLIKKGVKK